MYFDIVFMTIFLINSEPSFGWKFDNLNLDEDKISLSRIVVSTGRAYIAIPRIDEDQTVTLVEVPWPENSLLFSSRAFPNFQSQELGECSKLQSAITMDTDGKGRLYVLDQGWKHICPPKIIVYSLRSNKQLLQKELQNVPVDNLSSLTVDVHPYNGDIKVILGDAGRTSLLVYNFKEHIWWRLVLNKNFKMSDKFIASDDEDFIKLDEKWSFSMNQLAVSRRSSILYATSSESVELFNIDLAELRGIEEPSELYCNWYDYNNTDIAFQYVGNKFGKSNTIFVDSKDDLYYFYRRDYAVIRWKTYTKFTVENMEVVLQDDTLMPQVTQIFSDTFRQLWVLNSKRNALGQLNKKLESLWEKPRQELNTESFYYSSSYHKCFEFLNVADNTNVSETILQNLRSNDDFYINNARNIAVHLMSNLTDEQQQHRLKLRKKYDENGITIHVTCHTYWKVKVLRSEFIEELLKTLQLF